LNNGGPYCLSPPNITLQRTGGLTLLALRALSVALGGERTHLR
jgi:hypothetical protein